MCSLKRKVSIRLSSALISIRYFISNQSILFKFQNVKNMAFKVKKFIKVLLSTFQSKRIFVMFAVTYKLLTSLAICNNVAIKALTSLWTLQNNEFYFITRLTFMTLKFNKSNLYMFKPFEALFNKNLSLGVNFFI
jgi:hypothetical protein